jgi:hypothetical protein
LEAAKGNKNINQKELNQAIIDSDNWLKEANKLYNENKNRLNQYEKLIEAKIFEEKQKQQQNLRLI